MFNKIIILPILETHLIEQLHKCKIITEYIALGSITSYGIIHCVMRIRDRNTIGIPPRDVICIAYQTGFSRVYSKYALQGIHANDGNMITAITLIMMTIMVLVLLFLLIII